ncbi:MAG TPA: PAS domain-containing sensor histidine kinase [Candidatus Thermoplasmatota archaeon]|nr:PAS domain-containing sensor histidine kinase [Candidatus Thermoplasmatota archaeon]
MSAAGARPAAFFDACPVPAALVGRDGRVASVNAAWLAATGWLPGEVEGRHLREVVHPDDARELLAPAALRSAGLAGSWEARVACRDGSWIWMGWDVALDPGRTQYSCIARPRTAEEVRRQERFKMDFINMAAHELNTPLTPIQLSLETLGLRLEAAMDEDARQSVHMVQRNFERLRALVGELLDAARIHAGKLPLQLQRSDLATLARGAVEATAGHAAGVSVAVACEVEEGLQANADAPRLQQVMENYLDRAIDAVPAGGAVALRARRDGQEASVEVHGLGAHLTPAERDHLFTPFPPHEAPALPRTRTGLGLFMARGIVELHGGRVFARSEGPGGGFTLGFTLPLEGPAPPPEAARTSRAVMARGRQPDA